MCLRIKYRERTFLLELKIIKSIYIFIRGSIELKKIPYNCIFENKKMRTIRISIYKF